MDYQEVVEKKKRIEKLHRELKHARRMAGQRRDRLDHLKSKKGTRSLREVCEVEHSYIEYEKMANELAIEIEEESKSLVKASW